MVYNIVKGRPIPTLNRRKVIIIYECVDSILTSGPRTKLPVSVQVLTSNDNVTSEFSSSHK